MNYQELAALCESEVFPQITAKYDLSGCHIQQVSAHEGGRNLVFRCENDESCRILRISFLPDRKKLDYQAETEYVRYLAEHGASVADVIPSCENQLVEEISVRGHALYVSMFEEAKGDQIAEHNYRYREGAPLTEYFYNSGKTLGKIHQLSKEYQPVTKRYSLEEKYNTKYIEQLIPKEYPKANHKIQQLMKQWNGLQKNSSNYGMIHLDFSDGNYMIDYENGNITAFDFDNACFGFYMYDLANLWVHGTGWIAYEQDKEKRRSYMKDYFDWVVKGYRSETELSDEMLAILPYFIQMVLVESIMDGLEVRRLGIYEEDDDDDDDDDELQDKIHCLVEHIPFMGFFES